VPPSWHRFRFALACGGALTDIAQKDKDPSRCSTGACCWMHSHAALILAATEATLNKQLSIKSHSCCILKGRTQLLRQNRKFLHAMVECVPRAPVMSVDRFPATFPSHLSVTLTITDCRFLHAVERVSATYAPIVDVVAEPLLNMVPRVPGQLAHLLLTVGDTQRLRIFTTIVFYMPVRLA